MRFTKMQGAGNDFVVVDSGTELDWGRIAVAVCDRHYGIGADGLLVVLPSAVADIRIRIFNADGSEAGTCGNGIRCVVTRYADSERRSVSDGVVTVETLSGIREARFHRKESGKPVVQVAMGRPLVGRGRKGVPEAAWPLNKDDMAWDCKIRSTVFALNLVFLGNQHAVLFTDEPVARFPLSRIGPLVQLDSPFPEGLNFEVARVLDPQHIEARVWEHGVGETLACGSGACAVGVAASVRGLIGGRAEVLLPGGVLEVEWKPGTEVLLSGPAEEVFEGDWPGMRTAQTADRNEVLA